MWAGDDTPSLHVPVHYQRAMIKGADGPHVIGRESSDSAEVDVKGGKWIGNDTPLLAIPMFNECPSVWTDAWGVVPNGPGISRRDSRYSPQSSSSPDSLIVFYPTTITIPMLIQYLISF